MTADVENVGTQRITDFLLHVYFPRAFLNPNTTWAREDKQYRTETHLCFAVNQEAAPQGLYPGQRLRTPLTFEYFVDPQLFHDTKAMDSTIRVELFSGSIRKRHELKIRDYQEF
jgi:hypothetical protein